MKIGIDLDGVIFDTEKTFRVYSELYDMLELKQNSKENNYELKLQDRFNWSEEQINDFLINIAENYERNIIYARGKRST